MIRIFLVTALATSLGFSQTDTGNETPVTPAPLLSTNFSALKQNSPFTRSLNLSDSLILTGVAIVVDEAFATLIDKNTKQTYVVSSKPNAQGWKMLDLDGSDDIETITATISVDEGSTVRVRYDSMQLKRGEAKPASLSSTEPGAGGPPQNDKGRKQGPSSDMREKFSKMSEDQRTKFREKMMEKFSKNPNMSGEEREKFVRETLEKVMKK